MTHEKKDCYGDVTVSLLIWLLMPLLLALPLQQVLRQVLPQQQALRLVLPQQELPLPELLPLGLHQPVLGLLLPLQVPLQELLLLVQAPQPVPRPLQAVRSSLRCSG